ncbi:LamG domain-containing protein [Carboxylicivirga mesophila]|uniref:LamG domain-containing protein n=1 Tax=Carboxylicivirga mesophila TaxID=1166478 RepID=A0ABS5K927_9BACT|nr:LamG domain-containing protein [Carboxylicivirga mesophila]MBS2211377.1 LamG domain-containing protein [Carboxylicivirga mesophila]
MKIYTKIILLALIVVFNACKDGFIDDISKVDPGSDELAPTISISSPQENKQLIVPTGAGIPVFLEAIDDIELDNVSFLIDGEELDFINEFTDYRRYAPINGHVLALTEGAYTLQIKVEDKTGKNVTSDIVNFSVVEMGDFEPLYGETFYMSFQNHFLDHKSVNSANIIGFPGFEANGVIGAAYQGAEGASLSFPVADVLSGTEMSATFWYNIAQQGRSGILSASPSGSNNNRVAGFRLFREGGDDAQIIKLNVGNGSGDQWFDGGAAATVNPQTTDWVHIAITISESSAAVYINGEVVSEGALTGPMSLDNCEDLYIASGGPYFSGWGHAEDLSQYDELRIFQKALSQDEIKAIIAAEE